jgi:hypothetical protein
MARSSSHKRVKPLGNTSARWRRLRAAKPEKGADRYAYQLSNIRAWNREHICLLDHLRGSWQRCESTRSYADLGGNNLLDFHGKMFSKKKAENLV